MKNDVEGQATREEISHDHLFMVTGLSGTNLEKLAQGKFTISLVYYNNNGKVTHTY